MPRDALDALYLALLECLPVSQRIACSVVGALRSFLAVPAPADGFRDLQALADRLPRAVWRVVPHEQRHLTVLFLGEQSEARLAALAARLAPEVAADPPFRLSVQGLGVFPSPRRPTVLWSGCGPQGLAALRGLRAISVAAAAAVDLAPVAAEPFQPHLTLARRRQGADPLEAGVLAEALCAAQARTSWGTWEVRELVLFASELAPSGAHHTALARMPLAARKEMVSDGNGGR